jgi:tRNA dimethylallyltransferase
VGNPKVIAIVGPTCTGKTYLSLQLADFLQTEIIACDSRTIYKHMDLGTAKPSLEERAGIPHHLLDIIEPNDSYTVARYKRDAEPILDRLIAEGKTPIVCGGTGFYFRNLLEGLSIPEVEAQEPLRQDLMRLADEQGNAVLHARLQEIDPSSATRINVNDRFRIIRAIEVTTVIGEPFSSLAARVSPKFDVVWLGLFYENRDLLREKITLRLQEQREQGLVGEVRQLLTRYGKCNSLLATVSYKEIVQYLDNEIDLDQAMSLCAIHTNQLARRQLTWFRSNKKINWMPVDVLDRNEILSSAKSLL